MASRPVKRPLAEPPSDDALSEDTSKATKMPRSMLAQRSLNVTAVPLNWPYEAFVHFYPLSFAYVSLSLVHVRCHTWAHHAVPF